MFEPIEDLSTIRGGVLPELPSARTPGEPAVPPHLPFDPPWARKQWWPTVPADPSPLVQR
jgi:hypothetical protein